MFRAPVSILHTTTTIPEVYDKNNDVGMPRFTYLFMYLFISSNNRTNINIRTYIMCNSSFSWYGDRGLHYKISTGGSHSDGSGDVSKRCHRSLALKAAMLSASTTSAGRLFKSKPRLCRLCCLKERPRFKFPVMSSNVSPVLCPKEN